MSVRKHTVIFVSGWLIIGALALIAVNLVT